MLSSVGKYVRTKNTKKPKNQKHTTQCCRLLASKSARKATTKNTHTNTTQCCRRLANILCQRTWLAGLMTREPLRPATSLGAMHLLSSASMLRESKTFFHGDRIAYALGSKASHRTRTASSFRRISGKSPAFCYLCFFSFRVVARERNREKVCVCGKEIERERRGGGCFLPTASSGRECFPSVFFFTVSVCRRAKSVVKSCFIHKRLNHLLHVS